MTVHTSFSFHFFHVNRKNCPQCCSCWLSTNSTQTMIIQHIDLFVNIHGSVINKTMTECNKYTFSIRVYILINILARDYQNTFSKSEHMTKYPAQMTVLNIQIQQFDTQGNLSKSNKWFIIWRFSHYLVTICLAYENKCCDIKACLKPTLEWFYSTGSRFKCWDTYSKLLTWFDENMDVDINHLLYEHVEETLDIWPSQYEAQTYWV